jgi:adenylate cyclase
METEDLKFQVHRAVEASVQRFRVAFQATAKHPEPGQKKPTITKDDLERLIAAEYLNGLTQATQLLVRMEGDVTAQQLQTAIVEAGKERAFGIKQPDPTETPPPLPEEF